MTTDWKALCAELVDSWTEGLNIVGPMHRARALLSQPEPEGPTDEEILNLFWKHSSEFGYIGVGVTDEDAPALIREALARWGRPATEPKTNGQT